MIKKAEICTLPNLCGGKGNAEVHFLLNPEEFYGHARMYAKIVLPPGSSIGWHQHIGETEPYYILIMIIKDIMYVQVTFVLFYLDNFTP